MFVNQNALTFVSTSVKQSESKRNTMKTYAKNAAASVAMAPAKSIRMRNRLNASNALPIGRRLAVNAPGQSKSKVVFDFEVLSPSQQMSERNNVYQFFSIG